MTDNIDDRSPDAIERDIRTTQDEMSRTVEQIEGRLTGRNILNSMLDTADKSGLDTRYLIDSARRNPLALGMIALGGLWLVSDADARPSAMGIGKGRNSEGHGSDSGMHPDHRSYIEHMARCERQPGEDDASYRRRRDQTRADFFMIEPDTDEDEHGFLQRLDKATEGLRQRRDQTSESAHAFADQSRDRAKAAASGVQDFYHDNPLVSGLAAAFVGAIAGATLPASRTEESYVGGLGEQALDMARSKARQAGDEARHRKDDMIDKVDQKIGGAGDQDRGDTPAPQSGEFA